MLLLSVTLTKHQIKSSVKKEHLEYAVYFDSFRGFSPWSVGSIAPDLIVIVGHQEGDRVEIPFNGMSHHDLTSSH